MLKIWFEQSGDDTFVHMSSDNGVLGHAKEIREKIPSGCWLTMPSKYHRLTPWMVKKCGFINIAQVYHNKDFVDVLKKE